MPTVPLPAVLESVVAAGSAGLPLPSVPALVEDLDRLRDLGFPLTADGIATRLLDDGDVLVPSLLLREVRTPRLPLQVHAFLEVGSTNDHAAGLARAGAPEGTLVTAEAQSAGRGRRGRAWVTTPASSLSFSLVVRPARPAEEWPLLGLVASVSLVRALRRTHREITATEGALPELKWPNDVLVRGRKVAGILAESLRDDRGGSAAVIGVGVNVGPTSVPPGLDETAAALDSEWNCRVLRRQLLARFLEEIAADYAAFQEGRHLKVLESWKAYSSMWSGTRVWVTEEGGRWAAVTRGLDESGGLRLQTPDGLERVVLAGDVSIRPA